MAAKVDTQEMAADTALTERWAWNRSVRGLAEKAWRALARFIGFVACRACLKRKTAKPEELDTSKSTA